jgi:hypothetical protein
MEVLDTNVKLLVKHLARELHVPAWNPTPSF